MQFIIKIFPHKKFIQAKRVSEVISLKPQILKKSPWRAGIKKLSFQGPREGLPAQQNSCKQTPANIPVSPTVVGPRKAPPDPPRTAVRLRKGWPTSWPQEESSCSFKFKDTPPIKWQCQRLQDYFCAGLSWPVDKGERGTAGRLRGVIMSYFREIPEVMQKGQTSKKRRVKASRWRTVLEIDSGDGCTTLWTYSMLLCCTLRKMVPMNLVPGQE